MLLYSLHYDQLSEGIDHIRSFNFKFKINDLEPAIKLINNSKHRNL